MSLTVFLVVALVAVVVTRWVLACLQFRRLELSFPGPPSLPILGNALDFVGATDHDLLDRFRKLWGGRTELTRMNLLGQLMLIASDPDDIERVVKGKDTQDKSRFLYEFLEYVSRNGLVTLNGASWRAHRRALSPAFHHELLDKYQDIFDEEAKGVLGRIQPGVAQDVMSNLKTNSVMSFLRTALTTDVHSDLVTNFLPVLVDVLEVLPRSMSGRAFRPWLWSDILFGVTSFGRSFKSLVKQLNEVVGAVITSRRENLSSKTDANYEDFIKEKPTLIDVLLQDTGKMALSDQHMRDEIIVFTGAAIETTVASLGWIFKTLSLRHDVQDRIVAEVKEVLGADDAVRPEQLRRLEYTERVIKESLRLNPAVPMVGRSNLHRPTVFNGKELPRGTTFVINILGAHRDPHHWEDPLTFDPDRFLPERSQGRHHYAYLPFSAGPRNCIGGRYAMAVMKTLLATVLPKYRVDPVDDGHTDPSKFPMAFDIATRMPGGVHVVFNYRTPTQA